MPWACRRVSFTARDKLDAAKALEETSDARQVIKQLFSNLSGEAYESRRKLLLRWLHEKDKLEAQCSAKKGGNKKKARSTGIGTTLPSVAEDDLVRWVNDLRKGGVPVSAKMLALEAKDRASEYGVEGFQASWRWQHAFKARHKLSMRARTRTGQKTPADLDEISAAFAIKVRETMRDLGIKKVYNADQTGTYFDTKL